MARCLPTGSSYRSQVCHRNSSLPACDKYLSLDHHNRGRMSHIIALGGLVTSLLFSILCIAVGTVICVQSRPVPSNMRDQVNVPTSGGIPFLPQQPSSAIFSELPSLALNIIVMLCTESTAFVHSKALESQLSMEGRLKLNTNLRLITAARGKRWTNPNGTLFNMIMAILLIMSYVSSSLVFVTSGCPSNWALYPYWCGTCLTPVPILILGIVLLLQVVIAFYCLRKAKILNWSSSAFDTTMALLHNGQLTRTSGRCMHSVTHKALYGPKAPSKSQPSAWHAHPSVNKILIVIWSTVLVCTIWGGVTIAISTKRDSNLPMEIHLIWTFLPNYDLRTSTYLVINGIADVNRVVNWFLRFIIMVVIQGSLTMGLHCSELIVDIIRDEMAWRRATEKTGAMLSNNPLSAVCKSWPNLGLLVAKPVLRKFYLSRYCMIAEDN